MGVLAVERLSGEELVMDQSSDTALPHDEAVAFEAALDILGRLIGYAANKARSERALPKPDEAAIADWIQRRDRWALKRRDLRPRDAATVRYVLETDGPFLRACLEESL